MIHPHSSTIGQILQERTRFVVPKFQRGYVWTKSEAEEFLDDLDGDDVGELFLGTLIFDISKCSQGETIIVDGQQRITSILLLLIAVRISLTKLGKKEIATLTQQRIAPLDPTTGNVTGPLLLPSRSISQVFEYMADSNWDGTIPTKIQKVWVKREARYVRPVYDCFVDRIRNYTVEGLSKLLDEIYRTRIIRIDVDGDEEAFAIFERMNARGLDLEVSDLLKNYLYQEDVPGIESKWADIIENAGGTILRMLKYFYVSQCGPVRQKNLYRAIKSYAKGLNGAAELVDNLDKFSKFYKLVRTDDDPRGTQQYFEKLPCSVISGFPDKYKRIHLSLEALRLFKIAQVQPLLYAGITCFARAQELDDAPKADTLVSLLRALECYHFINTVICDGRANEFEKLYADYCLKYKQTSEFQNVTDALLKALRLKLVSKEIFVVSFCALSYSEDTIALIAYIFDRLSNYGLAPAERIRIYDADPTAAKKEFNVEHFFPQTPPQDVKPLPDEVEDNIGNLLVVSYRANSKLGNGLPRQKFEKLRHDLPNIQNLAYVRDFVDKYEKKADTWDKDAIEIRARDLAATAFDKVWKMN